MTTWWLVEYRLFLDRSAMVWSQVGTSVPSPVSTVSREHGFHAPRHFYVSEELGAGESVISLARRLGHSDPGFTLWKYSHFLPRAGARGAAGSRSAQPVECGLQLRRPKVPEKTQRRRHPPI